MKKLFNFIIKMHSADSSLSAKRVYGGFGFIVCVVTISIWKQDFLSELLYTSVGMIGLDTIRQIIKK